MALIDFSEEELKELSKCFDVDKSEYAPYEINGKVFSTNKRKEHVYRLQVKDSDIVYIFVFKGHKLKKTIQGVPGKGNSQEIKG